jgi:hypothetical protein
MYREIILSPDLVFMHVVLYINVKCACEAKFKKNSPMAFTGATPSGSQKRYRKYLRDISSPVPRTTLWRHGKRKVSILS